MFERRVAGMVFSVSMLLPWAKRQRALLGFAAGVVSMLAVAALRWLQRPRLRKNASSSQSLDEEPPPRIKKQRSSIIALLNRQKPTAPEAALRDSMNPMAFVERRFFQPPRHIVDLCEASTSARPWEAARQRWVLDVAKLDVDASEGTSLPKVHNRLWVSYRMWVDTHLASEGNHASFHNFVIARALGVPTPRKFSWSGTEAGDLLVCLAAAGVLVRGYETGKGALEKFLQESLIAFNNRFLLARNRTISGFSADEQSSWGGSYDFIQLADPQIGMFKMDADWAEELTMLRIAVHHVNRLKPRFLLVSGDLTNAWPSEKTREVIAEQVSSFKEAMRELDPSIPLILQPGNHDVGQNPRAADVRDYVSKWGDDYFSFWVAGVFYIAINSQYYHIACDNDEAKEMRKGQETWLESQLTFASTSGATHVVLLSHVTPFMGDEDEPQGHFNWEVGPRKWVLELAKRANVKLWLCGHYHGNHIKTSEKYGVEVVTTSSCGGVINWKKEPPEIATNEVFNFMECVDKPPVVCDAFHSGMRIVRVTEKRILHEWLELADVPECLDDIFSTPGTPARLVARPQLDQIMDLPTSPKLGHAGVIGWGENGRPSTVDLNAAPVRRFKSLPAGSSLNQLPAA